jgi:TolA-binding protein
MEIFEVIMKPVGLFLLAGLCTGCLTLNEQRQMRSDITALQGQISQLEQNLTQEKTSDTGVKAMASTGANIDRLSQQQSKMAGDIDLLRRALEKGDVPGIDTGKESLLGRLNTLESRMTALEQSQKEMLELLEKSGGSPSSSRSDSGASDSKPLKDQDTRLIVDPKQSGSKAIKEARVLFNKNKWKQIIEVAPQWLPKFDKKVEKEEFFSIYSESLFKSGDIKEAAIKYNEFLEMKPSKKFLPLAKMRMGDCYRHLGDNDTALIYYNEVIKDFPKTDQGIKAKERVAQLGKKEKQGGER